MEPIVVRAPVVSACFRWLRELPVHTLFQGYLAIVKCAHDSGKSSGLRGDIRQFHDTYLRVEGNSRGTEYPYVRPFVREAQSNEEEWLYDNLAGTYGGSLKPDMPLMRVIKRSGSSRKWTYSLPPEHASLALKYLCDGQKLPAMPLALFLYRDYGVEVESFDMAPWISRFKTDFGYHAGEGIGDYNTLYYENLPELLERAGKQAEHDLFERLAALSELVAGTQSK